MRRFIILLLGVTLVLSACQNTAQNPTETQENATEAPTQQADLGYVFDGDDVHITQAGTTLADMTVKGDLYIDDTVGDGDVTIENITVEGTIYVYGGGQNSVHFFSMYGYSTIVRSPFDTRVTLDEVSNLGDVFFESGGTVEYYGPEDYSPVSSVNIGGQNTNEPINVNLNGSFNNVNVNSQATVDVSGTVDGMYVTPGADGTQVNIDDGGYIDYMDTYSQVDVMGADGSLGGAMMGASGSNLPGQMQEIGSHTDGTQVTVGGESYTLPKTSSTQYIGEYDKTIDGSIGGDYPVTGIASVGADYYGTKAPNTLTIERINVVNSKMPATLYYSIVPRGNSAPSKQQIKNGFGIKSGSLSYTDKSSDYQNIIIEGFNVNKRTKYSVYFLLVTQDGKEMNIKKCDVSVAPPKGQEQDDESNQDADQSSDSASGQPDAGQSGSGYAVDGYPKVTLGGQSVTVTMASYQQCKVYFLIEAPHIMALGTTAQDVKNGISKGAGTSMGGDPYEVFYGTLSVDAVLKAYTTTFTMSDGSMDGTPPDGGGGDTPGVFLVIEYADGTLSQVYVYH